MERNVLPPALKPISVISAHHSTPTLHPHSVLYSALTFSDSSSLLISLFSSLRSGSGPLTLHQWKASNGNQAIMIFILLFKFSLSQSSIIIWRLFTAFGDSFKCFVLQIYVFDTWYIWRPWLITRTWSSTNFFVRLHQILTNFQNPFTLRKICNNKVIITDRSIFAELITET